MYRTILVVGGTRFFGIPMIKSLLQAGYEVTVATRGNTGKVFGDAVTYVTLDRCDSESVRKAIGGMHYDVIIDKVAYSSNDVKALLDHVTCDYYIQMSTGSVYDMGIIESEDEFDPHTHELKWCNRLEDYQETKRQAEAAAVQCYNKQKNAFVRYPVVLGKNDYTRRLCFYAEHIMKEIPMKITGENYHFVFIQEDEAGELFRYLVDHPYEGALNGTSDGTISVAEIVDYVEKKSGKKAVISMDGEPAPFNITEDEAFCTDRAKAHGFRFMHLNDYIWDLLDYYIEMYR